MTHSDDHLGDMAATDAASAQFLDEMRSLADIAAPEPSDELEALFGSALPLEQRGRPDATPVPAQHRVRRHPLLTAAAVFLLALAALITGAATHHLPAYAQRVVSNVVNTLTPFHIDPTRSHARPPAPSEGPPSGPPASRHPSASRSRSAPPSAPRSGPSGPSAPTASLPVTPSAPVTRSGSVSVSPTSTGVRSPSTPRTSPPGPRKSTTAPASPAAASAGATHPVQPPGKALGRGHTGPPASPGHAKAKGNPHGVGTVGGDRPAPSPQPSKVKGPAKAKEPKGDGKGDRPGKNPGSGHGKGRGNGHGNGHGKGDGKGHGKGQGHAKGHGSDPSVHVRVQVGVAEVTLRVAPGGKLAELGQPGVVRAHVGRGHAKHLPPVRAGRKRR
jgi:hypothetical protein